VGRGWLKADQGASLPEKVRDAKERGKITSRGGGEGTEQCGQTIRRTPGGDKLLTPGIPARMLTHRGGE